MTSPVVGNFNPPPTTPLSATGSISFDVTDAAATLRAVLVVVKLAGLPWEVAFDGTTFGPNYSGASSKAPITNGYHFVLARAGGWPSGPTFLTHAIDTTGQEAS